MGTFKVVKLLDPLQIVNIPSGLVPRGAYDNGNDYAVGDSVDYNGSSYVMFSDTPAGNLPTDTTYWQVLANKGDTGNTGPTGPGVPTGGTIGQLLSKASGTDYDTIWKTTTTADISDSSDKRYVTDAELSVITNTSGVNTGDQDLSSYLTITSAASQYLKLDASNDPITGDLLLQPSSDTSNTFIVNNAAAQNIFVVDALNQAVTVTKVNTTTYDPTVAAIPDTIFLQNTSNTDSDFAGIQFRANNTSSGIQRGYIGIISSTSGSSPIMVFGRRTGSTTYAETLRIDTSGNIGIGTNAPTKNLSFSGQSLITIGLERNLTSDTIGQDLTLEAGGSTLLSTNKRGGTVNISSGVGTGTGNGGVAIKTYTPVGSGTTDQSSNPVRIFAAASTNAKIMIGNNYTSVTDSQDGLNLLGTIAQNIYQNRHTTSNTAGNNLNVQAGGATTSATDKNGGVLALKAGVSTGNGSSQVNIFTAAPAATGAVATISLNAGGTGYTAGDTLTITGGGGNATVTVSTVDGSGVILTIALNAAGTGYGTSNAYPTTGGTGTGAKINILTLTGTADNSITSKFNVLGDGKITTNITLRDISGTVVGFNYAPVYTTPISSSAGFRTFNLSGVVGADSSAVETYTGSLTGIRQEFEVRTTGIIGSLVGMELNPFLTRTSGGATAQVTTVKGMQINAFSKPSGGSTTVTVTNLIGLDINVNIGANLTATNLSGIIIENPTAGTFTTMYGIDVAGLTRAATTNIGIRVGLPSGATNNYALQLSDTSGVAAGGITFGTDVELFRSAANVLKTNDSLFVVGDASILGSFTITDAKNIALGTTTGTKIGTSTSQKLGFWNATPVVQSTGWGSITNVTTDRAYDANSTTIDELADVLGTLINQLVTYGLLGA